MTSPARSFRKFRKASHSSARHTVQTLVVCLEASAMKFLFPLITLAILSAVKADKSSNSIPPGGTQFKHFIAMNETQTCIGDEHSRPFNNQIRGGK